MKERICGAKPSDKEKIANLNALLKEAERGEAEAVEDFEAFKRRIVRK